MVLSALPVCERDFQISLREGVGLPRLADKQTMANSVGGEKSLHKARISRGDCLH